MSDGPESLVLRYLRNIDTKLDRVIAEQVETKARIGSLEEGQAAIRRELVGFHEMLVRMLHAIDRLGDRVGRLERGTDLVPSN